MPHDCAPTVTRRQFIGCSAAAMAGLAAFGCLPTGGVRTSEQVATQALSRSALATVNVATTGVAKGIADIEGITHHHQPEIRSICHCPLSQYDHDYNVIPVLAERVPSIDDGTWVVSPDGPMRMTWRLRRNAKWHDGHPFTARDVRFSWEFNNDRSRPIIRRPIHTNVTAVDTSAEERAIHRNLRNARPRPNSSGQHSTTWSVHQWEWGG